MRSRTSEAELDLDAIDAFIAASDFVGLQSLPAASSDQRDLVVKMPDGSSVVAEIKGSAIPTTDRIRTLAAAAPPHVVLVLVADQISATARAALNEAHIGWLDRRGHFRLVRDGIHIDADVPHQPRTVGETDVSRKPIAGRSGLAAATALLLRPEDPVGVSETARIAGLNRSSITRAMTSLVDAHLADRRERGAYRALVPELFWALADVWPRDHVTVRWATGVDPDAAQPFADPGDASWVAAGVRGALAWSAPLVVTGDYPTELYVPDQQTIRRIAARHQDGSGPAVILSADPNGFVTKQGFAAPSFAWPIAHPLFCALDLTATSRDREALEQWTPPEEFTRVW